MGRNWHEWQAANRWYFTRETLNLMLLSPASSMSGSAERRSYSLDRLSERMQENAEAASWLQRIESLSRFLPARLRQP